MRTLDVSQVPPVVEVRHSPWSSGRWCDYFSRKRETLLPIPWGRGVALTFAERDLVASSLPVFQQGEAQEGGHFYRCARAYAAASGDLDYAEAHALFMDEEKRHGRDLARFLTLAGIPVLMKQSSLARAFCWCGSRGGLEPTLLVILMSEVMALVYYAVLRRATGSAVLRRLCTQILRDEKQHVRFHGERLAILRRGRPFRSLRLTHGLDLLLFAAAVAVCWCGHRHVFRAGGLGLVSSWNAARSAFRAVERRKDPTNYRFI